MGFEPECFDFDENIASVDLPIRSINLIQSIINYFKSWIDNANNQYPIYIKTKKMLKMQENQTAIKREIEKQKKIKEAVSKVHL